MEWIRFARRVAVHLSDRVEALLPVDAYLTVALVSVSRAAQEVLDTMRALQNIKIEFKTKTETWYPATDWLSERLWGVLELAPHNLPQTGTLNSLRRYASYLWLKWQE